ncbi:FAD-binding domain-containing protein [Sphingorhabdus sp.]|uniref:FAD-binding domain-containing protein n=1 Tax=Sphingorhabdus sp. TaxID=1902408 RepID=UPI0039198D38
MILDNFPAMRSHALARLAQFAPRAGRDYATGRNSDPGPQQMGAVSKLSPYIRYRLITEQEVVGTTLGQHSVPAAEKYVQEVLWRTYWKGWLEMRPSVWTQFVEERDQQRDSLPDASAVRNAEHGVTGIEGFDDWARELVETGYLHNHARMWFASIWIFTLRLPWVLGADFFLRHLVDADAASNTLSWRWVAGLQTAGKTYLATTDNIERFTNGRFAPKGLATVATVPSAMPFVEARPLPQAAYFDPQKPAYVLVTPEDLHPESVIGAPTQIRGAAILFDPEILWGENARSFVAAATGDVLERVRNTFPCPVISLNSLDPSALLAQARESRAEQIITPYAPVGPIADALTGIAPLLASEGTPLVQVRRSWDETFWPLATKGFFPFKERVPMILRDMGLAR